MSPLSCEQDSRVYVDRHPVFVRLPIGQDCHVATPKDGGYMRREFLPVPDEHGSIRGELGKNFDQVRNHHWSSPYIRTTAMKATKTISTRNAIALSIGVRTAHMSSMGLNLSPMNNSTY